jgi:hypothetical protein
MTIDTKKCHGNPIDALVVRRLAALKLCYTPQHRPAPAVAIVGMSPITALISATSSASGWEGRPRGLAMGALIRHLPIWFEHYNTVHPHRALNYRSPREFIASRSNAEEDMSGL